MSRSYRGDRFEFVDKAAYGEPCPDLWCAECKEPTQAKIVDDSFSHGFGTERVVYEASDCCEAGLLTVEPESPEEPEVRPEQRAWEAERAGEQGFPL